MERFEWAENNLDAQSPQELQSRGMNVYFAPQIASDVKLVDLGDGTVDTFPDGAQRPDAGYYAPVEHLERYCREQGLPVSETEGRIVLQPIGTKEAGDPLHKRGY